MVISVLYIVTGPRDEMGAPQRVEVKETGSDFWGMQEN
jgi:hypothetical protein